VPHKKLSQTVKAGKPARMAFGAGQRGKLGPVMGVRVLGPAVKVMRAGAEKVQIDTVHGFRPGKDCPLGMP